jgi:hypothetical protein
MSKKGIGIFREELPGEKKSIINLVMTGYLVAISCMGYMAFYLYIQLGQVERIVSAMNRDTLSTEQFELLKSRVMRSVNQLSDEMIGLTIIGAIVSIIGAIYTFNLVVKPLKKLVEYTNTEGKTLLPEIKPNNEIKQLSTAISNLTARLAGTSQN